MDQALRPGLSFCLVGGRPLFLDAPADRYFCLSPPAEQAFLALVHGEPVSPQDRERLAATALLVSAETAAPPAPCPIPARSGESLLDRRASLAPLDLAAALLMLARTSLWLRRRGFAGLLDGFAAAKARVAGAAPSPSRIAAIVAGFVQTGYLLDTQDRCLVRSFALARRLVAAGARPEVVLAVKLEPFKAHCWVQLDGMLVSDRHDVVRDFTPIRVL